MITESEDCRKHAPQMARYWQTYAIGNTTVGPLLTYTLWWTPQGMGYGRLCIMGYERSILVYISISVRPKSMGYGGWLWQTRGMG